MNLYAFQTIRGHNGICIAESIQDMVERVCMRYGLDQHQVTSMGSGLDIIDQQYDGIAFLTTEGE